MQVGAGRRRVPVVGVHHVGLPARVERAAAELRCRPAQQREALQVVGPVSAVGVLVGAGAAPVEQRRVDHIGRNAAAGQAAQAQRDGRGSERRADRGHRLLLRHRLGDGGQPGQQQAHIGTGACEGRREGGGDVGEAAGLDEREDFGGDVEDAHRSHAQTPLPLPLAGEGRGEGAGVAVSGGQAELQGRALTPALSRGRERENAAAAHASAASMSRVTRVMPRSLR